MPDLSLIEATWLAYIIVSWLEFVSGIGQRESEVPVAVVVEDTQRYELKTLPEGFVIVRQMTYGERLQRQSLSSKMKVSADKKSEYAGEFEMAVEKLGLWDFQNLVVDHNLEDQHGNKLNFKNVADIKRLSSRIGEEIGKYIDDLNSFEDIEEGN